MDSQPTPDDRQVRDEALRQFQSEAFASPGDEIPAVPVILGPPPALRRRRVWLPFFLFLATCLTTFLVGGWQYSTAVMTILVCHEAGHFLQAWRYGVPASFPYFIPLPIPPIGTMGAVIGMSPRIPHRRALFDIGITGPLAGLIPTLAFCIYGLKDSKIAPEIDSSQYITLGEPLLLKILTWWTYGPLPDKYTLFIGPLGMAGWVGLLITSLNLFPIGQLDGGHILYALLRRRAHFVAKAVVAACVAAVVLFGYVWWVLMLGLVLFLGPSHPPTADDEASLGPLRILLGWLCLGFLIFGFTPNPGAADTIGLIDLLRLW